MNEAKHIKRTSEPVTLPSLVRDLSALGVEPGAVLLVHSSLSALGWVCGGAQAVVLALEQVLGEEGTLVMPAHSSDLSDPAQWEDPPVPRSWWETIRQTMPAFAPDLTPTRGMGAIAETFRKQEGVLRSDHPQVSFCARGPLAAQVTADHALAYSLGEGSPLARLYELDARVLLLGADHDSNTSLHLADYRARYAGKKYVRQGAPICVDGQRQWASYQDIALEDEDFAQIGEDFARSPSGRALRAGKVALAPARLFPQRAIVDFAVQWMEQHRGAS